MKVRWLPRVLVLAVPSAIGLGCRPAADAGRASPTPIVVSGVGFATPETVLHDPDFDVYYVSNSNGSPLAADDNGFISVLSTEGDTLALKWIDGGSDAVTLHAPQGMAVSGRFLYVADISTIRRFDRRSGAPQGDIPIPGSSFLNDVTAADDGTVYFTDSGLRAGPNGLEASGTDAVYRLTPDGALDTLARGRELGNPTGIAVSGDTVWVLGVGGKELYRVANGGKTDGHRLPEGGMDGLLLFAGDVFLSSRDGGSLFRGPIGGPYRVMLSGLRAPADVGHDIWRNRLLVPLVTDGEVRIVPLVELSRPPPRR